ncbi:MAG TPA: OmpW family outer membrane protein [Thermoanaerobaculia bacterium]
MKFTVPVIVLAVLLTAAPLSAQNRYFDLTANAVWMDTSASGTFEDLGNPSTLDFDPTMGYGIAANIFFGNRISAEFAIARVNADTNIARRPAVGRAGGELEIMPVTAVLQFHFAPHSFIDPYIGVGAAYVLFDDISANGIEGLDRIDFDDDVGLAINAGLGIRLGSRFGITLDGKYVPLDATARAIVVGGSESADARFDVNPIILSAGLTIRF